MLKIQQHFITIDKSYKRSKRDSMKGLLVALVLTASIFSILIVLPSLTYAQTSPTSSSSGSGSNSNGNMKKQTSGGALDVILQPSPQPVVHTRQTSLKVQFMTKGSETVQPHIDYDLIIKDSNGKQVFSASQLAGQSGKPLHTAEGIVTIPYTFQGPGDYLVSVPVYGILFNPIRPESADFTIKVT
jgi:hypothetical protein